jgi:hypothetical protein
MKVSHGSERQHETWLARAAGMKPNASVWIGEDDLVCMGYSDEKGNKKVIDNVDRKTAMLMADIIYECLNDTETSMKVSFSFAQQSYSFVYENLKDMQVVNDDSIILHWTLGGSSQLSGSGVKLAYLNAIRTANMSTGEDKSGDIEIPKMATGGT